MLYQKELSRRDPSRFLEAAFEPWIDAHNAPRDQIWEGKIIFESDLGIQESLLIHFQQGTLPYERAGLQKLAKRSYSRDSVLRLVAKPGN